MMLMKISTSNKNLPTFKSYEIKYHKTIKKWTRFNQIQIYNKSAKAQSWNKMFWRKYIIENHQVHLILAVMSKEMMPHNKRWTLMRCNKFPITIQMSNRLTICLSQIWSNQSQIWLFKKYLMTKISRIRWWKICWVHCKCLNHQSRFTRIRATHLRDLWQWKRNSLKIINFLKVKMMNKLMQMNFKHKKCIHRVLKAKESCRRSTKVGLISQMRRQKMICKVSTYHTRNWHKTCQHTTRFQISILRGLILNQIEMIKIWCSKWWLKIE